MQNIVPDLRYALRTLLKRPAFAFSIVFIFALGTGVNTAIFTLVYNVLIRPLPYAQAGRLVRLWEVDHTSPQSVEMTSISNLEDWRERNRTLEGIAAWKRPASTTLTAQKPAREIHAASVTANFFSILSVNAAQGRTFLGQEEVNQGQVIVISHGFWQTHLGGITDAIGKQVELDGNGYTIVGITPPEFQSPGGKADIWLPMSMETNSIDRGQNYLQVIARMKQGVSARQAQADLDTVASALEREYPSSNRRHGVVLIPMQQQLTSAIRMPLIILSSAVGLVLLIACMNISNLLVVRGFDRRREFSIRLALGGTRVRILSQLLAENLRLFLAGGFAGILLSQWILRGLLLLEPDLLSDLFHTNIHWETIIFSFGVSLFAGIIFGSIPAIRLGRQEIAADLKVGDRSSTGDKFMTVLRRTFVSLQIGLSLTLMIAATLLVQSFISMRQVPFGFDGDQVLIAHQAIDGAHYRESQSKLTYYKRLLAQLRQIPGVRAAAASTVLPMGRFGIDFQAPYSREDHAITDLAASPQAYFRAITPDYFQTLQIPVMQGRSFRESDDGASPLAVIVNQTLARKTWPGQNPVGKKIRIFWADWRSYEVVGVVRDTISYDITSGYLSEFYVPHAQIPYSVMNVAIRFNVPTADVSESVRKAFLEVDPLQPVQDLTTMQSLIDRSITRERFVGFLVSAFGILAIVLASAGIYGTVSFSVASKTREIGLRMALGATRLTIRAWILKQGAGLILPGIFIGATGSFAAAALLKRFLFRIEAIDPITFVLSATILCLITLLACFVPAKRAAALEPNIALHHE